MAGKWKPDTATPRPVPVQYAAYIWKKQKDFLFSMYGGALLGVALTTAVLHFHGGLDVLNVASISQMALYSGLLVTAITIMSKMKC